MLNQFDIAGDWFDIVADWANDSENWFEKGKRFRTLLEKLDYKCLRWRKVKGKFGKFLQSPKVCGVFIQKKRPFK